MTTKLTQVMKSLQFRIVIILVLFGMIPALVMRGAILSSYEDRTVSVRTAEIQNQCTILANQIKSSGYLANSIPETVDAELSLLSNIYGGRVLVIDSNFRILKDTYHLEEGKTIVSSDVIKCYREGVTSFYDAENRYIEVAVPIIDQISNETVGIMLACVSTDGIVDSIDVLTKRADLIIGTLAIIIFVIAYTVGVKMVKPFKRIATSIGDINQGYDSNGVQENTFTETTQISEAFNKVRNRFKVLDDSRQEFVSNVSHELKTPLTSMKVLADSLLAQEGVPLEMYQEFMQDMSEEIERENEIINDLLTLVKMDKTAQDLNIKSENINELIEMILKRLHPIAELRNIELVLETFRPVIAEVDVTKISLALSNLIENAIKYNSENGWVHVSLNADHKYCYIKIEDSGMGMPEEALEHIFERFYRVDKSHSREIGGTGLGLAIARGAVVMHRGAIKVHSELGEGTTFTVRLPLTQAVK
ncbi:cell wall metabolism sensor histidine kinase WalK [Lachnospiraceae bacterium OttesenSCG-928-E19]|nr:cell wall metabolism sensor histidine kinase WalK [Lachnospiraceae bacterium OttesenSCG-928-E19]